MTEGIEFRIPHSLRGVGPFGPYGFRLVDRAYSSERPEAAIRLPNSFLFVQLQYISPGRNLKAKKGIIQFYIELMVGKLDSIFIAIGVVSNYPDDGKGIFGNG